MNFTFLSFGTRGDVQPTLALAKAVQARGHRVRMVASSGFAPWIERHGIEAFPARIDIQALMTGAGGQD